MAKTTTTGNYKSLISKSADQVQKEQIDITVDQAQISLDQGLLSVQSQLLNQSSGVKTAEGHVAAAELALNNSKGAVPFNVQSILDLRRAKLQSDEDLIVAKAKVANLQGAFDYLKALKTELFG